MKTRTIPTEVTFKRPFSLGGDSEEFPAGTYKIKSEEERDGLPMLSRYHRVGVTMQISSESGDPDRILNVTPQDLEDALKKDKKPAKAKAVSVSDSYTK